jgi:DNA gyrase subunit A
VLDELLEQFLQIEHRREVVRRRSQFELEAAEDRAHILEGRLRALENAESVVELIRDSEDRDAAIAALQERYEFSTDQAEHIVRMQLGSLTSMEAADVQGEYEDVTTEIERLQTILDDESELMSVVKDELREVKAEYDDERRTDVVEDTGTVTREDLVPEEDVVVVLSEADYVKRMPLSQFDPQHRGGKGIIGADLKEGDGVATAFVANTHDYLLCFTNQGQVYRLKVYQLPEMGRTARGKSAVNIVDLDDGEDITAVVNVDDLEDDAERYLAMVTRDGYVKRTAVEAFENVHSGGIRAVRLEDDDALVDVEVTDGDRDLLIATRDGMTIRFDETDARAMGRTARGVGGIELRDDDAVAGMVAAAPDDDRDLLTVTENGYGKRTPLSEYRVQARYGYGLVDIRTDERNGRATTVTTVTGDEDLVIMSRGGQITRIHVGEISTVGRNTKGVRVMRLEDEDHVACIDVAPTDEGEEDEEVDAD